MAAKRKMKLAFMKIGLDKNDCQKFFNGGHIWGEGPRQMVVHEFMTLPTFNRKVSLF